MAINRKVDIDDPGDHLTGTVHTNAWLQDLQDRIDALVGDWTAVAFAAGNFTSDNGAWTVASGDVIRNRYQVINKTLRWDLVLNTSTLSATPTHLYIAIPTGLFASLNQWQAVDYMNDNGTVRACLMHPVDTTHLDITRVGGGTFAASTDATYVYFSSAWELA